VKLSGTAALLTFLGALGVPAKAHRLMARQHAGARLASLAALGAAALSVSSDAVAAL